MMTDEFIDYVNGKVEDLDMTKSPLTGSVGLDESSVTKYPKEEWTMSLHVALKIVNYLNMDIGGICGIQTEQVLMPIGLNLMWELRGIRDEISQVRLTLDFVNITKSFSSSHRQHREQDTGLMVSLLLSWLL